jgi:hypothetical protein
MAELKTKENDASVDAFLGSVKDEQKREDSKRLRKLFEEITGDPAKMWGSSIVGFGNYHFKYKSGREGDWLVAGFSPRKDSLTLYLMGSYEFVAYKDLLGKLGKHKTSKGCLYIKKLEDVDMDILRKLITRSVEDIKSGKVQL